MDERGTLRTSRLAAEKQVINSPSQKSAKPLLGKRAATISSNDAMAK
jgi:hypothetical protein